MRLMTAKTAGPIQAAETIIHGRKRGNRTSPQYRWSSSSRNTVHVSSHTVRVLTLEAGHKKAHKAQKLISEGGISVQNQSNISFVLFVPFCG
jgi:hypothetical protein